MMLNGVADSRESVFKRDVSDPILAFVVRMIPYSMFAKF